MSPLLLALAPACALAQDPAPVPRPSAAAFRTARAPKIDGVLEPEVWELAPTIGPLTQVEPDTGAAPSERTDVRVMFDDRNVYLGIRCFDREPHKIVATQPSRDAELDPDDRLEIVIDTFHDRRSAFYFQMSPAGSKGDALITGDGADYNKPWDGIWEGKTTIDSEGWSAEIAIPLKTLSFDQGTTTWGFNLNRVIKRRNEFDRWASPTPDAFVFQISRAGDLTGLVGLEQGLGLDVVPFGVASWSKEHQGAHHDEDVLGTGGLDAFYRLTPNLTASLTLNTDFAETEVDERKVNLTRFPLFFPEKRDFFLQDAGLFDFGGLESDLIPFFSRRIGLSPAGEEVPIHAGAKLTGRQAGWDVGVLDVETGDTAGIDGENLFVGRVARNFGPEWSVGALATRGDPGSDLESFTYGFDGSWRTNDGPGGKRLVSHAWYLESATEDVGGDDRAFGGSVEYPNDRWSWSAAAKQIGAEFDPKLGFVPRRGVRRYDGSLRFGPRIGGLVRQLSFGVDEGLVTDLDGDVETSSTVVELLGLEFESGDELAFELDQSREVLDAPFAITSDVTLPPGTYDDTAGRIELATALKRPLSLEAGVTAGEFLGGDSVRWSAGLAWRPAPLLNTALQFEQNDIDFAAGKVETQVARVRLELNFTPDLSWSSFVQWDSESDEWSLNSRWRWIPVPGQELFLVYNQTSEHTSNLQPLTQQLAVKAAWTLRL